MDRINARGRSARRRGGGVRAEFRPPRGSHGEHRAAGGHTPGSGSGRRGFLGGDRRITVGVRGWRRSRHGLVFRPRGLRLLPSCRPGGLRRAGRRRRGSPRWPPSKHRLAERKPFVTGVPSTSTKPGGPTTTPGTRSRSLAVMGIRAGTPGTWPIQFESFSGLEVVPSGRPSLTDSGMACGVDWARIPATAGEWVRSTRGRNPAGLHRRPNEQSSATATDRCPAAGPPGPRRPRHRDPRAGPVRPRRVHVGRRLAAGERRDRSETTAYLLRPRNSKVLASWPSRIGDAPFELEHQELIRRQNTPANGSGSGGTCLARKHRLSRHRRTEDRRALGVPVLKRTDQPDRAARAADERQERPGGAGVVPRRS